MAKFTQEEISDLLRLVGGSENIAGVTNCITRMRFVLNDPSKADPAAIENLPSVKGTFTDAGLFQVVIGPDVGEFCDMFVAEAKVSEMDKDQAKAAARQNMNPLERAISHLAEIFVPLLPALITGGLILGFRNVIGDIKLVDGQTLVATSEFWAGVHSFLWLIGEAIFHFLPVGVTWSAARKMGATPILGIILGITLVSPQLMNAYAIGSGVPDVWSFGFFEIEKVGYQAQVIPALLCGIFLAWFENLLKKIIPGYLYLVLVPFIALLTAVLLAHTVIGPFGRWIGDGVAWLARSAMTGDWAFIGATLFGFFYAPLVITGVHHTTNAVDLQLMQDMGGTPIWPLIALSNIAQGSAVLGIIWLSKKANEREISVPAAISAFLGVTEPAMYGINLKYKFPMLCAMIGSACAALICGLFGVMANGIGVGGLPAILSIQAQYWAVYLLAMLVAFVVPVMLTMVIFKKEQASGGLHVAPEEEFKAPN